ncbi:hypothetical protein GVX82_04275 [Patescibacteria group bacterium]|jgi:hypothetical protein|nr:hypothetical protein [Patescibacteria group bacterium]
MPRLPRVGGDSGNWGTILNQYLLTEHNNDGTHRGVVRSDTSVVSGAFPIENMLALTQDEYDDLRNPDQNTIYVIYQD